MDRNKEHLPSTDEPHLLYAAKPETAPAEIFFTQHDTLALPGNMPNAQKVEIVQMVGYPLQRLHRLVCNGQEVLGRENLLIIAHYVQIHHIRVQDPARRKTFRDKVQRAFGVKLEALPSAAPAQPPDAPATHAPVRPAPPSPEGPAVRITGLLETIESRVAALVQAIGTEVQERMAGLLQSPERLERMRAMLVDETLREHAGMQEAETALRAMLALSALPGTRPEEVPAMAGPKTRMRTLLAECRARLLDLETLRPAPQPGVRETTDALETPGDAAARAQALLHVSRERATPVETLLRDVADSPMARMLEHIRQLLERALQGLASGNVQTPPPPPDLPPSADRILHAPEQRNGHAPTPASPQRNGTHAKADPTDNAFASAERPAPQPAPAPMPLTAADPAPATRPHAHTALAAELFNRLETEADPRTLPLRSALLAFEQGSRDGATPESIADRLEDVLREAGIGVDCDALRESCLKGLPWTLLRDRAGDFGQTTRYLEMQYVKAFAPDEDPADRWTAAREALKTMILAKLEHENCFFGELSDRLRSVRDAMNVIINDRLAEQSRKAMQERPEQPPSRLSGQALKIHRMPFDEWKQDLASALHSCQQQTVRDFSAFRRALLLYRHCNEDHQEALGAEARRLLQHAIEFLKEDNDGYETLAVHAPAILKALG